jgi:hypothetical protein
MLLKVFSPLAASGRDFFVLNMLTRPRFRRYLPNTILLAFEAESIAPVPDAAGNITHQMLYADLMRTTLDIDDDLLLTIKEIARQQGTTAGSVVSRLLRESLQPKSFKLEYRDGVPLLPRRLNAPVVTSELVNRLRDEDE